MLKDFLFLGKKLLNEEIDDKEKFEDLNFNFDLIGSKGWSCLHAACSSGNTEIVEFLVKKK